MSQHESPADETRGQLREYLGIVRFRKWSILLVTLIIVGVVIAWSARQTPKYESEAKVLVEATSISGSTDRTATPNLDTEREVLSSNVEIAEGVVERLEVDLQPQHLLRNLRVDVIHRTEILSIRFQSPDPVMADRGADAFARAYLALRRQQAIDELLAVQEQIGEQIESLEQELATARDEANATPAGSVERTEEEARVSSLESQITSLRADQAELIDPKDITVGSLVQPSGLPSDPVSPDHVRNGLLGLFLGLFLGIGVAFLRERLDDRLRGRDDLEQRVGAPVLAVVPRISTWRRRGDTPVTILGEPKSAAAEAYRTLRTSLLFSASQRNIRTIMIVSAHQGEGKTSTAANLAVSLAQAHKRVILVSADLRKPRVHRFFGVSNDVGLTTVLTKEAKPWEALHGTGVDYLKVMASGPVPGNPAELLGSEAMRGLLAQLREVADFLVIDSAPVLAAADAVAMASFVDAVVMIADAENTTRGAIEQGRIQLAQVQAPVIGAVLNNLDPSKARTYEYYSGAYYYYYEGYGEEPRRGRKGRRRKRRARRGAAEPAVVATAAAAQTPQWGFEAPAGPAQAPAAPSWPQEPQAPLPAAPSPTPRVPEPQVAQPAPHQPPPEPQTTPAGSPPPGMERPSPNAHPPAGGTGQPMPVAQAEDDFGFDFPRAPSPRERERSDEDEDGRAEDDAVRTEEPTSRPWFG